MLTGAASYSWIISTVTHGAGGCYIPDMKVAWFVVAVTALPHSGRSSSGRKGRWPASADCTLSSSRRRRVGRASIGQ